MLENIITVGKIADDETFVTQILAHLFSPKAQDGDDRILKALLRVVFRGNPDKAEQLIADMNVDSVVVQTERVNKITGKRLDIVILANNFALVIENKINHTVGDNDLQNSYKDKASILHKEQFGNSEDFELFAGYFTRNRITEYTKQSLIEQHKENVLGDFYALYDDLFAELRKTNYPIKENLILDTLIEAESGNDKTAQSAEKLQNDLNDINDAKQIEGIAFLSTVNDKMRSVRLNATDLTNELTKQVVNYLSEENIDKQVFNSKKDETNAYIEFARFGYGLSQKDVVERNEYQDHSFTIFYDFLKFSDSDTSNVKIKLITYNDDGTEVEPEDVSCFERVGESTDFVLSDLDTLTTNPEKVIKKAIDFVTRSRKTKTEQ